MSPDDQSSTPDDRPDSAQGSDASLGIHRLVDDPVLHEPVLLVMMQGWIDATGAAATAADEIANTCEVSPIARFDDDMYIDYRARRPTMELRNGINTNLVWSTIELGAGRSSNGRDVLILSGPEPDMAWHRFARAVSQLAVEYGVTDMLAFGAYPFAAPHTRDPRLSVSSPSIEVLANVPYARSSVDVPAGMAAALEHAMDALKIPALGLWVQVPHYITSMEYPAASVALIDAFTDVTGIDVEAAELRADVAAQRARLDRMVGDNDEHAAMLRQLEAIFDAAVEDEETGLDDEHAGDGIEPVSGDELAAEIQQFLRDQK